MEQTKKAALVLISRFFGMALKEAKDQSEKLTLTDKAQLASAIAREQKLTQDDVNFEMIPY